ncbi:hypothetical protein E2C01_039774 [Portunus trituberculatus]|uniref:Uncharacterized protein n=1 Tax=Portunus trituberculatus TaxID=210409 RepID=A0A5B7FKW6_PORTR|nr:hypothetical protein [Portunus trituberculatus]
MEGAKSQEQASQAAARLYFPPPCPDWPTHEPIMVDLSTCIQLHIRSCLNTTAASQHTGIN